MPFRGLGILGYVGVLIIAWIMKDSLFTFIASHLMYSIGVVGGIFLFAACLPVIEIGRGRALRRFWRQRLEKQEGFSRPSSWWRFLLSVSDPINRFLFSFFRGGLVVCC